MKINLKEIAEKLDFDLEDVKMIFESFLDAAKKNLQNLEKAIKEKNLDDIAHFAHSIKGSALNLRLDEVSEKAKNIELSAKNGEDIDYEKEYMKLKELIYSLTD